MTDAQIQDLCERGQRELMSTDYLAAIETFTLAENAAWNIQAFDTLSRLYLPLQEAHRQARQRCGEGAVRMRVIESPGQPLNADTFLDRYPTGQFLLAGRASIAPALKLRKRARERRLYAETFLAAVYTPPAEPAWLAIIPLPDDVPPASPQLSRTASAAQLPVHSIPLAVEVLPAEVDRGNSDTFASVMMLWERLHRPFLQAADAENDPMQKMIQYRTTLAVDPACELAHQNLAAVARQLARSR